MKSLVVATGLALALSVLAPGLAYTPLKAGVALAKQGADDRGRDDHGGRHGGRHGHDDGPNHN